MPLRTARAIKLLCVAVVLAALIGVGGLGALRLYRAWSNPEMVVTLPEGITAREIDDILAKAGITPAGSVSALAERDHLEGYLFPDTYRFHRNTDPEQVVQRLRDTFTLKAGPLVGEDADAARKTVIIASLLEREVTDPADGRIVAGIIEKRLKEGMPLQIDATICYIKKAAKPNEPCYPLTRVDLTNPSPYNTYLYRGLTPGPIGNPGIGALTATIHAEASPYWFYLSDPATGKTVFSVTNEEHNRNRKQYLE